MLPDAFQVDTAVEVRALRYALECSWILVLAVDVLNDECQVDCG